jgi:hypothetical protein
VGVNQCEGLEFDSSRYKFKNINWKECSSLQLENDSVGSCVQCAAHKIAYSVLNNLMSYLLLVYGI